MYDIAGHTRIAKCIKNQGPRKFVKRFLHVQTKCHGTYDLWRLASCMPVLDGVSMFSSPGTLAIKVIERSRECHLHIPAFTIGILRDISQVGFHKWFHLLTYELDGSFAKRALQSERSQIRGFPACFVWLGHERKPGILPQSRNRDMRP